MAAGQNPITFGTPPPSRVAAQPHKKQLFYIIERVFLIRSTQFFTQVCVGGGEIFIWSTRGGGHKIYLVLAGRQAGKFGDL